MSDDSCNCGCSTTPEPATEPADDCACGCECCGEAEPKNAVA
jgi:hypothetical protein